jgi:hypothetical protein
MDYLSEKVRARLSQDITEDIVRVRRRMSMVATKELGHEDPQVTLIKMAKLAGELEMYERFQSRLANEREGPHAKRP